MRAIAGGTISFGLVSIPVKLYPATQSAAGVSFHLLHKDCNARLKQQYICPVHDQLVPREDMVKGYEYAKDQYVVFTPAELKAMEEKATQTIDIATFVPAATVDPIYFDKPYFLGPEKGGEKAYRLLASAMDETERVALARYAARGKQYLVMLRPADGAQGGRGLVMQQLLYADEVRSFGEVPIADSTTVKEPELKLARQLIDQIASDTFDPTQFEDDVRKRILADVQRKVDGQAIETEEPSGEPARVIDLMEALKASLGIKADKGAPKATDTEDGARTSATSRKPAKKNEPSEEAEPLRATAGEPTPLHGARRGRSSDAGERGGGHDADAPAPRKNRSRR